MVITATSKKEQCKAIMLKYFGPATSRQVDDMSDGDCVSKCRTKVMAFFGPEKAKEFDSVI